VGLPREGVVPSDLLPPAGSPGRHPISGSCMRVRGTDRLSACQESNAARALSFAQGAADEGRISPPKSTYEAVRINAGLGAHITRTRAGETPSVGASQSEGDGLASDLTHPLSLSDANTVGVAVLPGYPNPVQPARREEDTRERIPPIMGGSHCVRLPARCRPVPALCGWSTLGRNQDLDGFAPPSRGLRVEPLLGAIPAIGTRDVMLSQWALRVRPATTTDRHPPIRHRDVVLIKSNAEEQSFSFSFR